ncbi:hypothetical protein [Flavobacterium sp. MDT1-60]|uniref:hypothetical protein n=1 Tax=Flavobacterium sp. MDT1-60 TaxID=1979344 RepID=UPI00177CFB21|nr:hypothetical protein [Flavobacterium sp. MDT1-60]QOG03528.1 hypothetical protein IHE43_04600 [Flavobacterium sp. MDT1-60]
MINIRSEYKTIFFFTVYFIITFIYAEIDPGGPCAPGMGAVLFLLAIPISIIYTIALFYKLYKSEEKQYLYSIFTLAGLWVLLFILLKLNEAK